MKKVRAYISLILIALLIFSCTAVVSAEDKPKYVKTELSGDIVTLLDYDGKQLSLNPQNGTMIFSLNGHSYPLCIENADEDTVANIGVKNEMRSIITVQYADESNTRFGVGSYVGSIKQNTYTVKTSEDKKSVLIEYDFSREKELFKVPVYFSFEDNAIVAEIDFADVKERGTAKILSISLLPYFFVGHRSQSGYVIVPDGSGMGVSFSGGSKGEYSAQIYGDDVTLTKRENIGEKQAVSVPVIGIVKEDEACVSYIRSGDANAAVYAQSAETKNEYTSVGFDFVYRQMDVTVLADKSWNEREIYKIAEYSNTTNPEVVYNFLYDNKAQPAGMAEVYRNYLIESGKLSESENTLPCVFEVFGAVKKQKSFLGIPYYSTVTSTTVKQTEKMISEFSEIGCDNSVWTLYGFLDGGMYGNSGFKAKLDSAVGNKKQYKTLIESAKNKNADILLAADLQGIYGTGYFSRRKAVKKMDTDYALGYFYKRNLGSRDKTFTWYLSKENELLKNANRFLKGYSDLGGGIALGSFADELYSDYGKGYTSRDTFMKKLIEQGKMISEKSEALWQTGANAYAAENASGMINIPSKSSKYELEGFELPFYALIFKGAIPIAAAPVNSDGVNVQIQRLKNIETGMLPHFRVTYSSPNVYNDTKLNFLLNTEYKNWLNVCSEQYKEFKEVHYELRNSTILSYTVENGLRKVSYQNGTVIYVNYDSNPHSLDGITVEAMNYIVEKPKD